MYALTYRGMDGQTGLYARIKRRLDEYWWDNAASAWVADADSDCDISLTEGTAGIYAATGGCTPMQGGVYAIYVYDSDDNLVAMAEEIYSPEQLNALEIINEVQKDLRLSQSSAISETHAALLLSFLNTIQQDIMMDGYVWPELNLKGAFGTRDGISLYYIYPANGGVLDKIESMQIGDDEEIEFPKSDERFRELKRQYTTEAQPLFARIYGRAGAALVIELLPTPDDVYQVDFEALMRPAALSTAAAIPILDSRTIQAGVFYLAKEEQGDDFSTALAVFQMKLSSQSVSHGDENTQDVEPV